MTEPLRTQLAAALRTIPRRDLLVAGTFCIVAASLSLVLSGALPRTLFDNDAWDVWFDSDLHRIHDVMTNRWADARAELHPLFAMVVYPPTKALMVIGVDPMTAVRLVHAGFSGLWMALLFGTLRTIGCRRSDASLFTLAGLVSASAVVFLPAPETFLVGSIGILAAIMWAAADPSAKGSRLVEAVLSAGTLAITITNWSVGILSAFCRRGWRDAFQITASALAITMAFWTAQNIAFPFTKFFFPIAHADGGAYSLPAEGLGMLRSVVGFFAHTMVMPEIQIVDRPSAGRWPLLLTQASTAASAGVWGWGALAAWGVLLISGLYAVFALTHQRRLRLLLAGAVATQLAVHLVYGSETFLYSTHWMPLLVIVAALATLTRWRPVALVFAGVFCLTAAPNNFLQFREATAFLRQFEPLVLERRQAEARTSRRGDPWPGTVKGVDAPEYVSFDTAVYEAGGTLWPAIDDFHAALWVVDATGRLVWTSHDGAVGGVISEQTVSGGVVRIGTVTPYYRAVWESPEPRMWRLKLDRPAIEGPERLYLVLRGVGWEFNSLYSVERSGADLLLNSRWRVSVEPSAPAALGVESEADWMTAAGHSAAVSSPGGWAFAKIGPLTGREVHVTIADERRDGSVDLFLGALAYSSPGNGFLPAEAR